MPRKNRSNFSSPPPLAEKILTIVRLLPAEIDLPNRNAIYDQMCDEDPEGRYALFDQDLDGDRDQKSKSLSAEEEKELDIADQYRMDMIYGYYNLRAVEECISDLPKEFVEYLEMPKFDLASAFEYIREGLEKSEDAEERKAADSFEAFAAAFGGKPTVLAHIQYGRMSYDASRRYMKARDWYRRLYRLAWLIDDDRNYRDVPRFSYEKILWANKIIIIDGRIVLDVDQFTDAFLGVPAERIRLCDACGRVYWVRRLGTRVFGCTENCSTALRTRKWRERLTPEHKIRYKINRIKKEK